ncbi:RNA polymerase sigma factor [Desulfopila sp. IMCC35008]|uniref:RNA polymerase sigma factor n=1 Tax=Desulfopila sp. IMCC35008 TaxID=2653858 RepID=UPI0013D1CB47|nr:RNA polymerase sigma factor [Desulfopila sp. IMCC35008]
MMKEKYHLFYSKYRDKLFSYLLYKSGDPQLAEDIMQDSFTRHLQYYGPQNITSPSLLFKIARNALVDQQRYQNKFNTTGFVEPETVTSGETSLITKQESSKIFEALEQLPEQERKILAMAVKGVPYKEIAVQVDSSVANIKVRIHRTRKRLQQMLMEEEK